MYQINKMEGFQSSSEDNEAIMDIVTKANVVRTDKPQQQMRHNQFDRSINRELMMGKGKEDKTKNKLNMIRRGPGDAKK